MGVAENLEGLLLKGKKRTWRVLKRIERTEKSSEGSFSVAYLAESTSDNQKAFLKATDVDLMTDPNGASGYRFLAILQSFDAEMQILNKCQGNRMDRIVSPLDSGQTSLVSKEGVQQPVIWLAQELADADAKILRAKITTYDFDWTAKAMHNLATAVQQLHSSGISHNNIRPSALLSFGPSVHKLGDLAHAISPDFFSMHAEQDCIGDPRYAAPEIIYGFTSGKIVRARQRNDLYLLGSVGFFLVTNTMLTPKIFSLLSPQHRPYSEGGGWGDGFENVLPYLREAHSEAMEDLAEIMPTDLRIRGKDYAQDYVNAIAQLTDPSPLLRGHPDEREKDKQSVSVERYVSLFDRLSNVAKMLQ